LSSCFLLFVLFLLPRKLNDAGNLPEILGTYALT
jgi:hypothetical protein